MGKISWARIYPAGVGGNEAELEVFAAAAWQSYFTSCAKRSGAAPELPPTFYLACADTAVPLRMESVALAATTSPGCKSPKTSVSPFTVTPVLTSTHSALA